MSQKDPRTDIPPENNPKETLEHVGDLVRDLVDFSSLPDDQVVSYLRELADDLEASADDDRDDDQEREREVPDIYDREDVLDQIDDAPPRASVTTKTIDGRSYYYYQWRDGEKVKSEYIGPVDPA